MAISRERLPRNIEAEKATLGAMLLSKSAADECLATLHAEEFFLPIHQAIFNAILNLNARGINIDLQTVTEELKNTKKLVEVGGVDYLYELTQSMLSEENTKEYASIVKQNANLRSLFLAMKEVEENYLKTGVEDFSVFVAEAQKKINQIADQRKISNFATSKEIVEAAREKIFNTREKRKDRELTGVDTGFNLLNYYTNGLQKQNLIIVAGRPGMGKTAFALQLALNAAMKDQIAVGIFEMEMSAFMLYSRLLSNLSSVKSRDILSGNLQQNSVLSVNENLAKLERLQIYVDESSALSILDIAAKARKLKTEQPNLGLIVIDYLGLITSDAKRHRRYDSRQLEIQEYTRALHELARDLDLPIVLLCQLNRRVEERSEGGTPRLSDLRESGAIEQDAEVVLLLHRDDYGQNDLLKRKEREKVKAKDMDADARRELVATAEARVAQEQQDNMKKNSPIMTVIVAKNRNGESDRSFEIMFEKEYSRFRDVSRDFREAKAALDQKYNE